MCAYACVRANAHLRVRTLGLLDALKSPLWDCYWTLKLHCPKGLQAMALIFIWPKAWGPVPFALSLPRHACTLILLCLTPKQANYCEHASWWGRWRWGWGEGEREREEETKEIHALHRVRRRTFSFDFPLSPPVYLAIYLLIHKHQQLANLYHSH